jgi:hypothetical protein
MKKINQKIILLPVIMLAMFAVGNVASASDYTGYLSTGVSTGVTGVVIAPPLASPTAGVYTSTQSVTLSADRSTSISYTTDGSSPTCSSFIYSSPITVSSSQTIEAISCYPNNLSSAVASFLYNINNTPVAPANSSGGGGGGGVSNGSPSYGTHNVDTNGDGKVDVLDFVTLMAEWGKTGNNIADFNGDGKVDILDFVLLMASWTK